MKKIFRKLISMWKKHPILGCGLLFVIFLFVAAPSIMEGIGNIWFRTNDFIYRDKVYSFEKYCREDINYIPPKKDDVITEKISVKFTDKRVLIYCEYYEDKGDGIVIGEYEDTIMSYKCDNMQFRFQTDGKMKLYKAETQNDNYDICFDEIFIDKKLYGRDLRVIDWKKNIVHKFSHFPND